LSQTNKKGTDGYNFYKTEINGGQFNIDSESSYGSNNKNTITDVPFYFESD
jgi:hypothetical protein